MSTATKIVVGTLAISTVVAVGLLVNLYLLA